MRILGNTAKTLTLIALTSGTSNNVEGLGTGMREPVKKAIQSPPTISIGPDIDPPKVIKPTYRSTSPNKFYKYDAVAKKVTPQSL